MKNEWNRPEIRFLQKNVIRLLVLHRLSMDFKTNKKQLQSWISLPPFHIELKSFIKVEYSFHQLNNKEFFNGIYFNVIRFRLRQIVLLLKKLLISICLWSIKSQGKRLIHAFQLLSWKFKNVDFLKSWKIILNNDIDWIMCHRIELIW